MTGSQNEVSLIHHGCAQCRSIKRADSKVTTGVDGGNMEVAEANRTSIGSNGSRHQSNRTGEGRCEWDIVVKPGELIGTRDTGASVNLGARGRSRTRGGRRESGGVGNTGKQNGGSWCGRQISIKRREKGAEININRQQRDMQDVRGDDWGSRLAVRNWNSQIIMLRGGLGMNYRTAA